MITITRSLERLSALEPILALSDPNDGAILYSYKCLFKLFFSPKNNHVHAAQIQNAKYLH